MGLVLSPLALLCDSCTLQGTALMSAPSHSERVAVQLSTDLGALAWIQYMRWARRADSVNASRKLFVKARKWPQCPWQARNSCTRLQSIASFPHLLSEVPRT